MVSDERLIEDLQAFADEIGETPTHSQMKKDGPWAVCTYDRHFGKWNNALEEANLPINREAELSKEQLIEDLQAFADEIGETPAISQMKKDGPRSRTTYERRFGSWNNALEEAGLPRYKRYTETKSNDSVSNGDKEIYNKVRQKVLQRDDSRCRVCGEQNNIHTHHIKPRREFDDSIDSHTLDNVVCLCSSCHSRFEARWQDADPDEFVENAREMAERFK